MDKSSISSDLIRGHIDTIILKSLIISDKFPQQISDYIKEKSLGNYEINQATLYSSLQRLEKNKFVSGYWNDINNGRRRYYKILSKGISYVEDNEQNWSFSRSVIDKLMDCESNIIQINEEHKDKIETPIPQIENIEKKNNIDKPVLENSEKSNYVNVRSEPSKFYSTPIEDKKEINYKKLLSELIPDKQIVDEKKEKLSEQLDLDKKNAQKIAYESLFNDKKDADIIANTIEKDPPKTDISKSKIDLSDLNFKATKEGFKLRISGTEKHYISTGDIYKNKVNFSACLITFFVSLVEILILGLIFRKDFNFTNFSMTSALIFICAFPVIFGCIYILNPKKQCQVIKNETVLTAFIIVFNCSLILFAINLIGSANYSDDFVLLTRLIKPILYLLDIMLFFIIRIPLSKQNSFKVKKQPF